MSHTPGPWRVATYLDEVDQIERQVISVPTSPTYPDKHVAHICTWGGRPDPEADANARLIAAAPDLIEALRDGEAEVLDAINHDFDKERVKRLILWGQRAREVLRRVDNA